MHIKLENVCFSYNRDCDSPLVLRDINIELKDSELVGIVGPTGSGKTTLIELISGFHKPVSGRVLYDDIDVYENGTMTPDLRGKIAVVFQFPEKQLFADTVFDDVAFAPRNQGVADEQIEAITKDSLALVGLNFEKIYRKSPFNLSGGEQRRVAIAGGLAANPEFVFMDEPTVALDFKGFQCIEQAVSSLYSKGKTVVIVTHDVDLIAKTATRIIALKEGSIVYDGCSVEFFNNDELVSSINLELPEVMRLMGRYNLDMKSYNAVLIRDELKKRIMSSRENV